jgi:hypothetical protein
MATFNEEIQAEDVRAIFLRHQGWVDIEAGSLQLGEYRLVGLYQSPDERGGPIPETVHTETLGFRCVTSTGFVDYGQVKAILATRVQESR